MKNFKRTLALVLAVIMVVGMFASVSAAKNTAWYSEGVRYIEGIGVATIGNTADEKITRDEFVLWVAKIESGNVKDSYWTGAATTSFTDVTEENNQVAIKYSEMRGFIEGNGDGTFAPDKNITLGEAAAVIVRLMRYQSKVESNGANWAWAHMEVANEYCKAFTYDFRNNVGGGIYDYDYELTKGEAAYLLATVMNGLKEQVKYNVYNKPVYKSLTIDGHNLGEMFIGHTNVGAYGDVYYVTKIEFNTDGTVDGKVVLTSLDGKETIELKEDEFTSLVRVSLGLTAEKEEDEAEICVEDTVKLGNLVDVTLDEDDDVVAIEVNSGSKVVDTHIVQYGMLEGTGRLNWTANSLVTGASNSMPDHEATMNANWSSDLLFTWEDIEKDVYYTKDAATNKYDVANEVVVAATLVFAGEEYDFELVPVVEKVDHDADATTEDKEIVVGYKWVRDNNDLVVMGRSYAAGNLTTYGWSNLQGLINAIPTVAEGEVTLIFNDADNDGEYDSVVINEAKQNFAYIKSTGDKTISYSYYYPGYMVDYETPSNKIELIVLASGRHYVVYEDVNGKDVKVTNVAEDTDKDHVINEHLTKDEMKKLGIDGEWKDNTCGKDKCNLLAHHKDVGIAMNPYQRIELGTIQSGVIEESVLTTVGSESYFRVKAKLAGGTYQTVYIPVPTVIPADDAASKTVYTVVGDVYAINNTTNEIRLVTNFDNATANRTAFTYYTLGELTKTVDGTVKATTDAYYAEDKLVFDYTINGATAEVDFVWDYDQKVFFAYNALTLTGIEVETGAKDYAKKAAKLVGQYISFMVDEDNVATYCVSGVAAAGESGYLLNVEETDVENMYNVTIATVDTNGKVEDVEIYNVNATASTMFAGADNYAKITAIFNKGNIQKSDEIYNFNVATTIVNKKGNNVVFEKALALTEGASYNVTSLVNVEVKSNGTFSYITLADGAGLDIAREDGIWNKYLNDEVDVTAATSDNGIGKFVTGATEYKDKDKKQFYPVGQNASTITATTPYEGKYYSNPCYYYDTTENEWVLAVATQTIKLSYTFGVDSNDVTTSNVAKLADTDLRDALVTLDTNGKVATWNSWVVLKVDTKGNVTDVVKYEGFAGPFHRGTENESEYNIAGKVDTTSGTVKVKYDFRGIDETYTVTSAKVTESIKTGSSTSIKGWDGTADDTKGFYTFNNATASAENVAAALAAVAKTLNNTEATASKTKLSPVANAAVYEGTKATKIEYEVTVAKTVVNNSSSISNVTFTAMDKTETGYIPGSYWFTIDNASKVYFNTDTNATKIAGYNEPALDADEYTAVDRKYRVTSTTEIVLLTPTTSGWSVEVMTPAEAAELDLIVTGINFVDPIAKISKKADYKPYECKLDAIVLVGQEALVETEKEVVDDGKDVSEGEYLVYVPTDAETSLYAPEGSKTIKVISNKSVYAVPSGKEIGSIFYEYNAYTGAEMPTIKSVIASGWYLVEEDGEIIDKFDWTGKTKTITVSESAGKVVAVDADDKTVDISKTTLLYMDANGTLKKVSDADVTFASGSVFATAMKSATTALETAEANRDLYDDPTKYSEATIAKYEAAYEAAVVAYNEALAANIDKYFNGNIWDSFVTVAGNESAIQGAGEYDVTLYTVDDATFIIVNTWKMDGDVAVIASAFN